MHFQCDFILRFLSSGARSVQLRLSSVVRGFYPGEQLCKGLRQRGAAYYECLTTLIESRWLCGNRSAIYSSQSACWNLDELAVGHGEDAALVRYAWKISAAGNFLR